MNHFDYRDGHMHCEDVPLANIVEATGTPVFIYSAATLTRHLRVFGEPFKPIDHLICYSMKACSNIAILRLLANEGAGADIVSGGELFRALEAGINPQKIVFSGVGKTEDEIAYALKSGIMMFNAESIDELNVINKVAQRLDKRAPVSLRINPDVDPNTHPYISTGLKKNKFGIPFGQAHEAYRHTRTLKHINCRGIDSHIGSQITEVGPFIDALRRLKTLIKELRGYGGVIDHLDIGGGLGITYDAEAPPAPAEYGAKVVEEIKDLNVKLVMEPGRVIVGNAAVCVTRVLYRKSSEVKNFVIVDAAMNDVVRPAFYGSYHAIQPVKQDAAADRVIADVVGPICETGDFIARDREVVDAKAGDLLAIMSAGAYGFSMSSNYNSRPRAAEILVHGSKFDVIRKREAYADLVRGEAIPEYLGGAPAAGDAGG